MEARIGEGGKGGRRGVRMEGGEGWREARDGGRRWMEGGKGWREAMDGGRRGMEEVFTLPHVIHMDSTGLHWSPVWSTGLPLDCKPLFRVQSQSSGLRVQSKSSGVHWSPLDSTGLLPVVLIVINY